MYLPDINAWLALAFPSHMHHNPARAWFDGAPAERLCHFCRFTEMGFLRLANNPSVFPHAAVTQDQAWKLYDLFRSNPRIAFASEPALMQPVWRQFTELPRFSPNAWSDAYLAAFAIVGDYEIVTFDQGFKQFPGLIRTILS